MGQKQAPLKGDQVRLAKSVPYPWSGREGVISSLAGETLLVRIGTNQVLVFKDEVTILKSKSKLKGARA